MGGVDSVATHRRTAWPNAFKESFSSICAVKRSSSPLEGSHLG